MSDFAAALSSIVEEQDLPGALAAVALPSGDVVVAASGYADKEERRPMKQSDRILSASIGKSFVAALTLALRNERKLDLDAKISTWLGGRSWFARLPNGAEVTLRMLLNHSSGIPDHIYEPRHAEFRATRFRRPDFAFTPEELVGFILDADPLFCAGSAFAYSDTAYILVGLILEDVLGRPYYEALQERFLTPLGLDLTMPSNKRAIPALASGYLSEGGPFGRTEGMPPKTVIEGLMIFNPANEWTGGGLATNPRDLASWAKALYEESAFEGPCLAEMLTPNADLEAARKRVGGAYGLGVIIRETEFGSAYGHTGGMPGYSGSMAYFPDHRLALAIQVNRTSFDIPKAEATLLRTITSGQSAGNSRRETSGY